MTCWYVGALLALFSSLRSGDAPAAEPRVELLWPAGAPAAKGNDAADKPELHVYLPPKDKATDTAFVVCPGGGYGGLAMGHEGRDIAAWLNEA